MRNSRASVSAKIAASVVTFAALALSASGAFAHVNNTTTRSNTQHNIALQNGASCPKGEAPSKNPTTGKQSCAKPSTINYNASKSNTRGARAATSPRYHCGKREYMLSNGDCVPNPTSNPN